MPDRFTGRVRPTAAIPEPDGRNTIEVLRALKEAIEVLTRQRGRPEQWPVTVGDLRAEGVIATPAQVKS